MNGDTPQDAWPGPPAELPVEPPPPPLEAEPLPAPDPYPFWNYVDVLLIAALTFPCMAAGILVVKGLFWVLHFHSSLAVVELLPAQILGYVFVFSALAIMFRAQYRKPLWNSLAWVPSSLSYSWTIIAGAATAIAVAYIAYFLKTPETSNPMTEMMKDETSLFLLAFFGIFVAPLAEELAFRGFLQPLLVRSFGNVYGILLAAIPFGILHFHEYGDSWRHALVISMAGVGFGVMRHATGSTKASTLMHSAYNAVFFAALWGSKR